MAVATGLLVESGQYSRDVALALALARAARQLEGATEQATTHGGIGHQSETVHVITS